MRFFRPAGAPGVRGPSGRCRAGSATARRGDQTIPDRPGRSAGWRGAAGAARRTRGPRPSGCGGRAVVEQCGPYAVLQSALCSSWASWRREPSPKPKRRRPSPRASTTAPPRTTRSSSAAPSIGRARSRRRWPPTAGRPSSIPRRRGSGPSWPASTRAATGPTRRSRPGTRRWTENAGGPRGPPHARPRLRGAGGVAGGPGAVRRGPRHRPPRAGPQSRVVRPDAVHHPRPVVPVHPAAGARRRGPDRHARPGAAVRRRAGAAGPRARGPRPVGRGRRRLRAGGALRPAAGPVPPPARRRAGQRGARRPGRRGAGGSRPAPARRRRRLVPAGHPRARRRRLRRGRGRGPARGRAGPGRPAGCLHAVAGPRGQTAVPGDGRSPASRWWSGRGGAASIPARSPGSSSSSRSRSRTRATSTPPRARSARRWRWRRPTSGCRCSSCRSTSTRGASTRRTACSPRRGARGGTA